MSVAGLGYNMGLGTSYYTKNMKSGPVRTEKSFGMDTQITVHMHNPDNGEKAVTSVGFPDGTVASVFSSDGRSEYVVKYWNSDGSVNEYKYDAESVNPSHANYLEMLVYSSHLDHTHQTKDAFGVFNFASTGVNGDKTYNSDNILTPYNFKQMTSEHMQAQYRFGNMAGYLSAKALYDRMDIVSNDNRSVSASEMVNNELSEEIHEELTPLGMGSALAGNMGYGMSAALVSSNATDDVIVRVKVAMGGGKSESVDVNLTDFDPKSATAVEMFAYCQYKDAIGEGVSRNDHTWGSWNAVKTIISPADGMNFGSLDNILTERRNWTGALASSKTTTENPLTGASLSATDILKMFEEQNKVTAKELKEGKDWRDMSDDEWDNLLESVDGYIDAYKEEIRERVKKQMEAAQKAALEADPDRQAAAAQEAALAVASSGFDAGGDGVGEETSETTGEDSENDHEKNWTRKLKTDDQVILRSAKAAQTMESQALQRMEEMMATGVSSYASYADAFTRFLKDKESLNFV